MYVSLVVWRDLEDRHLYKTGDEFPYDGREIPEDRIKRLSGRQNKAGFPLIVAVDPKVEETTAPEVPEEAPEEETEEVAEEKPIKKRHKGSEKS